MGDGKHRMNCPSHIVNVNVKQKGSFLLNGPSWHSKSRSPRTTACLYRLKGEGGPNQRVSDEDDLSDKCSPVGFIFLLNRITAHYDTTPHFVRFSCRSPSSLEESKVSIVHLNGLLKCLKWEGRCEMEKGRHGLRLYCHPSHPLFSHSFSAAMQTE